MLASHLRRLVPGVLASAMLAAWAAAPALAQAPDAPPAPADLPPADPLPALEPPRDIPDVPPDLPEARTPADPRSRESYREIPEAEYDAAMRAYRRRLEQAERELERDLRAAELREAERRAAENRVYRRDYRRGPGLFPPAHPFRPRPFLVDPLGPDPLVGPVYPPGYWYGYQGGGLNLRFGPFGGLDILW